MKNILSAPNVEIVAQVAWSRVLLAFDFDGTLAPIVQDRSAATMRPSTARLFARVCELYPCAVISGRSRADIRRRLGRAAPSFIVGNHGVEFGAMNGAHRELVADAQSRLETELAGCAGLEFEDKTYSLSIHYRKSRRRRQARERIEHAIARLQLPVRTIHGKAVVNVLPSRAPHKGDALIRLRDAAGTDTALFVGDDLTDEDIFALDQPGRLLTIRIGASRVSAANFYVRSQRDIDTLLTLLARRRTKDNVR